MIENEFGIQAPDMERFRPLLAAAIQKKPARLYSVIESDGRYNVERRWVGRRIETFFSLLGTPPATQYSMIIPWKRYPNSMMKDYTVSYLD